MPSPQFDEVKKVYQEIHTTPLDIATPALKVQVRNEQFFKGTGHVAGSWKLMKDGVAAAEGQLALPDISPGQTAEVEIATGLAPEAGSEYFLRVRYDLTAANAWHPAGMPIAWDEMPLPWGKRTPPAPAASETPVDFTDADGRVTVKTKDLTTVIDKARGVIVSMKSKDQEWLRSPLQLNFWRPTTNNDEGAQLDHKLKVWQYAGARTTAKSTTVARVNNDVTVTCELAIPASDSAATVRYHFTGSGQIAVNTRFQPGKDLPSIPRIGYQCEVPDRTPLWKWYGNGPHENYADRKSGSWTTIHEGLIPTLFHRYIDPQESGNRTGIRWATLASPAGGSNLRVDATGEHLLEMACYPCAASDIQLAMHPAEIPQRDFFTVSIDHRQAGLGGTDSWGALALPQYRIAPDRAYEWSFLLGFEETPIAPTAPPRPR